MLPNPYPGRGGCSSRASTKSTSARPVHLSVNLVSHMWMAATQDHCRRLCEESSPPNMSASDMPSRMEAPRKHTHTHTSPRWCTMCSDMVVRRFQRKKGSDNPLHCKIWTICSRFSTIYWPDRSKMRYMLNDTTSRDHSQDGCSDAKCKTWPTHGCQRMRCSLCLLWLLGQWRCAYSHCRLHLSCQHYSAHSTGHAQLATYETTPISTGTALSLALQRHPDIAAQGPQRRKIPRLSTGQRWKASAQVNGACDNPRAQSDGTRGYLCHDTRKGGAHQLYILHLPQHNSDYLPVASVRNSLIKTQRIPRTFGTWRCRVSRKKLLWALDT